MTLSALGLALLLAPTVGAEEPAQEEARAPVTSTVPDAPPPLPDARASSAPAQPSGLDGTMVGVLQLASSCAIYSVAVPALLASAYVCPLAICAWCALPAAVGYAGTWLGDRFGAMRGAAIWPISGAYGGLVLSFLGGATVFIGTYTGASWLAVGGGLAILAGFVASAAAVPIAYALVAEDKQVGDDGTTLPGMLRAGHADAEPAPPPTKAKRPRPAPAPRAPLPDLPPPPLLEPQGALRMMRF